MQIEPWILGFTKLELDNSRVKDVSEFYGLDKFADEVAIVKIESRSLDTSLKPTSLGEADYIYD